MAIDLQKALDLYDEGAFKKHLGELTDHFINAKDPKKALSVYCKNYYYFSLHQIHAFSQVLTLMPAHDRQALSPMAEAINDEWGNGDASKAHSTLFEKFFRAAGLNIPPEQPERDIIPGIKSYLNVMWENFNVKTSNDVKSLSTWLFLEKSAVDVYLPLLNAFREMGIFKEDDLEFFSLHTVLEQEHYAVVLDIVDNKNFDTQQTQQFYAEYERMGKHWVEFWRQMSEGTREELQQQVAAA